MSFYYIVQKHTHQPQKNVLSAFMVLGSTSAAFFSIGSSNVFLTKLIISTIVHIFFTTADFASTDHNGTTFVQLDTYRSPIPSWIMFLYHFFEMKISFH